MNSAVVSHAGHERRARCETLRYFRRPIFGWLQITAILFLIFQPLMVSRAIYLPDSGNSPYWFPLSSSDPAPPEGPDWTDDGSGNSAWWNAFQSARDSGAIVWWGGGDYLIDGVWRTVPPQYHAPVGDGDGDGIPDDLDPYPTDLNNHTFQWPGGTFVINNNSVTFDAKYFPGAWSDTDADSIPDSADPYPSDAANGNTGNSFWWDGGTSTINNAPAFFSGQSYSGSWSDSDSDSIPDAADPYPYEANNGNTYFYWSGGTYFIDGAEVLFGGGNYNGSWSEIDGDGIPDAVDPYVSDANNNTAWWGGGTFLINANEITATGQYHRADAGDADTDGIPDDLDSYPADPTNNTFYWNGGAFLVDGLQVTFHPQNYPGNATDSDGDGLPDSLDAYILDAANNTSWWDGGTFLLNGEYSDYAGQYYAGLFIDSDGDGIPGVLDPYPNDPWNNTNYSWDGGTFHIDGSSVFFPAATYGGFWNDPDGDGLPDVVDPYIDDGANNTSWWDGGTFLIEGVAVAAPGHYHRADAGDADSDGLPDDLDPYPADGSNHTFGGTAAASPSITPPSLSAPNIMPVPSGTWIRMAFRTRWTPIPATVTTVIRPIPSGGEAAPSPSPAPRSISTRSIIPTSGRIPMETVSRMRLTLTPATPTTIIRPTRFTGAAASS